MPHTSAPTSASPTDRLVACSPSPLPPPERLSYRPKELCRALGISRSTLDKLTRSGELTCCRPLPSVVLYPAKGVEAWLAAQTAKKGKATS